MKRAQIYEENERMPDCGRSGKSGGVTGAAEKLDATECDLTRRERPSQERDELHQREE